MNIIKSLSHLNQELESNDKYFLLIQKSSSDVSQCAVKHVNAALEDVKGGFGAGQVDVTRVRDVHEHYKVDTAPTLLVFDQGNLSNVIKGCMDENYYRALFTDELFTMGSSMSKEGKKVKNVIVYTTPTCSWCTKIKEHLKTHQIAYREVDVAANPSMAEEMRRKSGQMGVPQTEINGQMIVGFDRPKIDRLLEIGSVVSG